MGEELLGRVPGQHHAPDPHRAHRPCLLVALRLRHLLLIPTTNELFVPEGDRKKEQSLSHQKRKMEKMEAKKTPPSSPLALLPDTPSGLSSAPRQMSSREMVREKVNRIKEKAAAQKAERASSSSSSSRKQKEEEVVVSCYVGMPSVPDDHESEDSTGDEDEDEGKEHKRKDEEEEAGLDGRYAADDPVADIYSSTVETPAAPCGPSPYESFNRGAGEGCRPSPPLTSSVWAECTPSFFLPQAVGLLR